MRSSSVSAQVGVPRSGPDLDHPVAHVEDAHVEGTAPEVEHQYGLVLAGLSSP